MTVKVAINGFGRIGRMALRAMIEKKRTDIDVVAINDLASPEMSAHLFQYDSIHGTLHEATRLEANHLCIAGKRIPFYQERDPKKLPWKDLNVDVVMECSGVFTKRETAAFHLEAGAKRVIISAPASDVDKTIVYGVNHQTLTTADVVISNASCTTNCLAPVVAVLHEAIGIEKGFMTTIHAYTGDQRLVDTAHSDPRRARAGALSMIPTSTGAAKAVGLVLPALKGKLDGVAIRVPTPNVSLVDLTFTASKVTSVEAIHQAITAAAQAGPLNGILMTVNAPLVSIDFNHHPASSIFDLTQTHVLDGTLCRIVSWYDNEWGFANRMSDVAVYMGQL